MFYCLFIHVWVPFLEMKPKKRKYASKSPKKKAISSSEYDSDYEASKPTKRTKIVDDGDQKAYINRLRFLVTHNKFSVYLMNT